MKTNMKKVSTAVLASLVMTNAVTPVMAQEVEPSNEMPKVNEV